MNDQKTKKLDTQLDHVLWLPEVINKLAHKGIKEPIFRVVDVLKKEFPNRSEDLQRCLEKAIIELVDGNTFTGDETAKLKQLLEEELHPPIVIEVYMQTIPRDWSFINPFIDPLVSTNEFKTEKKAAEFICQTVFKNSPGAHDISIDIVQHKKEFTCIQENHKFKLKITRPCNSVL